MREDSGAIFCGGMGWEIVIGGDIAAMDGSEDF